jgi:hypothetical protein
MLVRKAVGPWRQGPGRGVGRRRDLLFGWMDGWLVGPYRAGLGDLTSRGGGRWVGGGVGGGRSRRRCSDSDMRRRRDPRLPCPYALGTWA